MKTAKIAEPQPRILKTVESAASNQPDLETYLYHKGLIEQADAGRKAAHKIYKSKRRDAMDAGIRLGDLDLVARIAKMEDTKPAEWVAGIIQYFRFERTYDSDGQADLFDQKEIDAAVVAKAATEGYEAGLMGRNADSCPHDHSTAAYQAWSKGWNRGQDVIKERFLQHNNNGEELPLE